MKKMILTFCFILILGLSSSFAGSPAPNWKKWDAYPDVPRISADYVITLFRAGEKMNFIYAGYQTSTVVCGSHFLPYTAVPPSGDGSRINLNASKDEWMVAYCP